MSLKKLYEDHAAAAERLRAAQERVTASCQEKLAERLKAQRVVAARVLRKLDDKHLSFHCPEEFRWALQALAILEVREVAEDRLLVAVKRHNAEVSTCWVETRWLFMSDWELASAVRKAYYREYRYFHSKRRAELAEEVEAVERQMAELAEAKAAKERERARIARLLERG